MSSTLVVPTTRPAGSRRGGLQWEIRHRQDEWFISVPRPRRSSSAHGYAVRQDGFMRRRPRSSAAEKGSRRRSLLSQQSLSWSAIWAKIGPAVIEKHHVHLAPFVPLFGSLLHW
jgi:hypothetical protein